MRKEEFAIIILVGCMITVLGHSSYKDMMHIGPDTTITFKVGESNLTPASKMKLNDFIESTELGGKVTELQIAAWSDHNLPQSEKNNIKEDRLLAYRRAETVRKYLASPLHAKQVVIHNMGESASWVARAFDTTDAELKTQIVQKNLTPMSKEEFSVFRDHGRPSKVVVLTILKY